LLQAFCTKSLALISNRKKLQKNLTHDNAEVVWDGSSGELDNGEHDVGDEEAGDVTRLAAPVERVVRLGQQEAGGKGGCEEKRRNRQTGRVQSEPNVVLVHVDHRDGVVRRARAREHGHQSWILQHPLQTELFVGERGRRRRRQLQRGAVQRRRQVALELAGDDVGRGCAQREAGRFGHYVQWVVRPRHIRRERARTL